MKLTLEIKSQDGQVHFRRWTLLQTRWGSVLWHHILVEDKDLHCHDHPWNFASIVLWGKYIELRDGKFRMRGLLSASCMPAAGTYHKIFRVLKPTWSLVFVGPRIREWGYMTEDGWFPHSVYRAMKRSGFWK